MQHEKKIIHNLGCVSIKRNAIDYILKTIIIITIFNECDMKHSESSELVETESNEITRA